MYCIINNGTGLLFFNGQNMTSLTDADEMKVLNTIYKANTGKDIPIMDWSNRSAPWDARLQRVVNGLKK